MNAKDVVKEIMKYAGYSQEELAKKAGYASQSNITGILNRSSSMRVDNLVAMVEAMGFEVIVRNKQKTNKQEYYITDKKE